MLLAVLERLTQGPPLTVFDTHAGAGLYDLQGEAARRSGEAEAGIVRLLAEAETPAAFAALIAAARAENAPGKVGLYPGSPLMALRALRQADHYIGCELRPDDYRDLATLLAGRAGARAMLADGYEALAKGNAGAGRRLVLIDPPFERGDEYPRVVEAVAGDMRRAGEATYLIWTPLKDLQTFDSFLGGLEAIGLADGGLAIEARLRPLTDPLRLNGCAVVVLGRRRLLEDVEPKARAAAEWIAERLGGPGAEARLERLA